MTKTHKTSTQVQDAALRKAIGGSVSYFRLSIDEQAEVAGVKRATWYRRLREPERFTLRELRRMTRRYGWDAAIVCAILGVREVS